MSIIRKKNKFCGFVTVDDRTYTFEINFSNQSFNNQGLLNLDWRLKMLLNSSVQSFVEKNEFKDPEQFFNLFNEFVQIELTCHKDKMWLQNPIKLCSFIKNLEEDLEKVGDFVKNVDIESGIVEVEVTDLNLRNHKAVLKLNQDYPRVPIEIISHDLPLQGIDNEGSFEISHLYSLHEFSQKFVQLVSNFQEFWNIMALLDLQCCVLDPANPTFKDVFRRVKLTDTLSVMLILNPFVPSQKPNIKLLGCQSDVNHYKKIFQKNLEADIWDCEEDLLYNLANILEVTIPIKVINEDSEEISESGETGECAICFMWRLNDEIPNEVCEKTTCKSMYHSTCLFTYLSSIQKHKNYFGKIQGECPNCSEIISCSVPKFI